MTQPSGPNAYDRVPYPSGVFATTHPDHLAAIARLHGLTAPAIETARVLEIGGGDGMNLIAMAAAYPNAQFLSIDLAEAPVDRGKRIVAAAGLDNVRVEVGDILDAARDLAGPFDYVLTHGVYAWVPPAVQDALMALIGRVLSPAGIAFVSYNALPGGHLRRIVREMALHHIEGIVDPEERLTKARAFIATVAQPRADDRPVLAALRDVARPIAEKNSATLFHDELGEIFQPQAFADVVAAAATHGLRFLNEAEPGRLFDGFADEPIDEADVVRAVQANDYENMCFFHQTLFVRDAAAPARRPNLAAIRDLYGSAACERTGPADFKSPDGTFGISDMPLADAIARLGEAWPRRLRIGDLVDDDLRLEAVFRLFLGKAILLHSAPLPGVAVPGSHPRASGLTHALLEMGEERLFTLDHRSILLDEPGPRTFLSLLDGSRDWVAVEADWQRSGYADETDATNALKRLAAVPLLMA